jgi:hypothetical protein
MSLLLLFAGAKTQEVRSRGSAYGKAEKVFPSNDDRDIREIMAIILKSEILD